jgi:hypothetical protein
VYRASALGDVTLITGVLAWWHKTREARFTVITGTPVPISRSSAVDEVVGVTQARSTDTTGGASRAFILDLAGMGFIDLHRSWPPRPHPAWEGPVPAIPVRDRPAHLHRFPFPALERRLSALNVPQRYALAPGRHASPGA